MNYIIVKNSRIMENENKRKSNEDLVSPQPTKKIDLSANDSLTEETNTPKNKPDTTPAPTRSSGRKGRGRRSSSKLEEVPEPFVIVPGACVFAKYEGCAWWPAKILERDSKMGIFDDGIEHSKNLNEHLVHFFATYDVAWIPQKKIESFEKGLPKYRKKCRSKEFTKAITEASEYTASGILPVGFETASNIMIPVEASAEGVHEVNALIVTKENLIKERRLKILRRLGLAPPDPANIPSV
eukprot:m.200371 g.200371  ORF g.200371 m.200371 type:complete len:240 (-) comp15735_c0_seq4:1914-2633(-)